MIQVRLFGPIEISLNGQPLPRLRSKKGRWLIALLALRVGKPLNREWLAQTLWPDQDLTSAKAYLRQTLTELRTVLGPASALLQSPDPQHLSLSLEVRVDLAEFDAAIAHDPQAAVALYTARLLEDCDEEWAIEARRTSEAILAETLANLGERAAPFQAVAYFARLVELDPFRESAQRSLIKALFELGDDAAATKAYRVFKLLLHRELHTEPSPETTALYRELRARIVEKNALVASGFQIGSQPASENHAPNGARLSTRNKFLWLAAASSFAIGISFIFIAGATGPSASPDLRSLPIQDLSVAAWKEAYGPNEQQVGEVVLARWPEIEAEVKRRAREPEAVAAFAAPLWRVALTLNKGTELAAWLQAALESDTKMSASVDALASAAVSFQLNMDSPTNRGRDLAFGRRAHAAALRSGDSWLIAHCLRARGFAERTSTDRNLLIQGKAHYDDAYGRFQALGDQRGMALMETCYATGGGAGLDYSHADFHACASWSTRAFKRWRRIGNVWGQAFAADQVKSRISNMTDPSMDRELCADAQAIFKLQGSRAMAAGKWVESKTYQLWETIMLIHLAQPKEAVKSARLCELAFSDAYTSAWTLLDKYERKPQDKEIKRQLLAEMRRLGELQEPDSRARH